MKRVCKQCGKEFELTESELDFYRKKNLEIPRRCKECREKNKGGAGTPDMRQQSSAAGGSTAAGRSSANGGSRPTGGGSRGIMAAVVGILFLLAVFFCLKQTGFLSDVTEQPSATAGIQADTPPTSASALPADTTALPETTATNPSEEAAVTSPPEEVPTPSPEPEAVVYTFRSEKLLLEHYKKHGIEMGFDSAEAYAAAANQVIANPDSLHKLEAEDGDDVYYLEATNEFVIVSTDGYIRTYFNPSSGIDYYNRQ